MTFFISGGEIIFIFLVVLLVFGADRIPEIARMAAKGIRNIKSASRDFREEIEKSADLQSMDTKALKKEVDELKKEINEISGTVRRKL